MGKEMTLPLVCCTGTEPAFCSGICCLMRFLRSGLVEVDHIGIEHALELLLLKDQQVIEAFLPHAPQEAFADGISAWRINRRFEDLDRARFRHTSKARPKFGIIIPNQILGGLSIGSGFSQRYAPPRHRSA